MIVAWIVVCDKCGKWINAIEFYYYERDYDRHSLCVQCYEELEEQEQLFMSKLGGYND